MPANNSGLSLEELGYINYLRKVLAQPPGSWEGFYVPRSPSMNFALRYQLAFGSYALAALAQRTPAYRVPYAEALRGAIDKMLDVAAWGYWRGAADEGGAAPHGHLAVLVSPHRRALAGPPSDPIAQDNLQYSGHLSTMLGLYEKLTGDERFDAPFELRDPESGLAFSWTHSAVAGRIHEQMLRSGFGGVCCESGMAYVPCNNHALASNALHDGLHGTDFSAANSRWLESVRKKMVLKGPAARGVFGAAYVKDIHAATPVAFNFTDAWGLALMSPFDRDLVRKLYRRFRKRVTRVNDDAAYLDSAPFSESAEISDVALNTGFALIAATAMADSRLVGALKNYAIATFDASWQRTAYLYRGAPRTLHSTALYALAAATRPGGTDLERLFKRPFDRGVFSMPFIAAVAPDDGSVGVSVAEYHREERTLRMAVRQVGDPSILRDARPVDATVTLGNVSVPATIRVLGAESEAPVQSREPDGSASFTVRVGGRTTVDCIVSLGV